MWKEKLEERIQGQHKTLRHERDSGAQLGIYAEWVERRQHQRALGGGSKEDHGAISRMISSGCWLQPC